MWYALFVLALIGGCGRIGFDSPQGDGGGGGGGDDSTAGGSTISAQQAYLKASNTDQNDQLGHGIALSADGMTLAVGASGEASSATGIGGDQKSNSAPVAGAVYVFVTTGTTWAQQAYLKASNTDPGDFFGDRVALSADGNTLAVSAIGESSTATGVNGNQSINAANNAGAIYIFSRSNLTWTQQAYLKATNTGTEDRFGYEIALSADGNTLAVGTVYEDSAATGIGGNQADDTATESGAVYVFTRSGTTWTPQAYIKASNTNTLDGFGVAIALSADGNTLAVGAQGESSAATGVGGNQADNSADGAGAAYVFVRTGTAWTQQAYIKAFNTDPSDYFGTSVALSSTGDTLAVSAMSEGSRALGVNGDQLDNSAPESGAIYVFVRAGNSWSQDAYVKASNSYPGLYFAARVALSGDGNTLVASAPSESSAATGINGNETDTSKAQSGAAYLFGRSAGRWSQRAYIKASNTDAHDYFGDNLAISADAGTLVVSAPYESSAATGVDGDQANNAAFDSGAVYVFH
jgi:FG-GAP repeat protein